MATHANGAKPFTPSDREIHSWLMDMDGVLIHEDHAIPGAAEFIDRLREYELPFLVLTNNSIYTPRDLAARFAAIGLTVPEQSIWTSALATARFLRDQRPGGSAYVIGESGLTTALHDVGYTLSDRDPDYVILGETRTYSFERITKAIRLILDGARFIATNPDTVGPTPDGPLPATGRGPRLPRNRRRALLRRQAKPVDDALRPQRHRSAFGAHGDDRRSHGHRHRCGP
jgi:NagD protein